MAVPPPQTSDWKQGFGRRLAIYLIGVLMGISILMVIQGIKARQRGAQPAAQPPIDWQLAPVPAPGASTSAPATPSQPPSQPPASQPSSQPSR